MTEHKQVKLYNFEVDEQLYSTIKLLNDYGYKTIYSCQGNNKDKIRDISLLKIL